MARMPLQEAYDFMDSMICSWKGPMTDVFLQVPLTPAMDASELLGCFEQALEFFSRSFGKVMQMT